MNKNIIYIGIIIAVIAILYFLVFNKKSAGDADLTNAQFEEKMSESDIVVLDVRSEFEFKGTKIPNAMNISLTDGNFQKRVQSLDKSKTYLVYCATGSRSVTAYKTMKGMGFENVYNLRDGIESWKHENKPVVR